LMQFQADISDIEVLRPTCVESTALGAAFLAGLSVGYWKNKEELLAVRTMDRTFYPAITPERRQSRLKGWSRAVQCACGWAQEG